VPAEHDVGRHDALRPRLRAGHLIVEASGTGSTVREYVWFDDMPLAVVADVDTVSPKLWYVHADHLNRPIKMTDGATKAVVWDAIYRPFGEVFSITGSASNNLRFPGQYFLIESGLHYNWHRHYDPTIGRYLQADPLEFADGPSMYAYAKSTPAMRVDPRGQQTEDLRSRLRDLLFPRVCRPAPTNFFPVGKCLDACSTGSAPFMEVFCRHYTREGTKNRSLCWQGAEDLQAGDVSSCQNRCRAIANNW
jgi:RHS repeat-associated protein